MNNIEFNNKEHPKFKGEIGLKTGDYYRKIIDLFSVLFVPEDCWVQKKQKDLLVLFTELLSEGRRDLFSAELFPRFIEAVPSIKDKNTIRIWAGYLSKKGWLSIHDNKFYMVETFENVVLNNSFGLEVTLKKVKKDGAT